jgi:hypothetical protein
MAGPWLDVVYSECMRRNPVATGILLSAHAHNGRLIADHAREIQEATGYHNIR